MYITIDIFCFKQAKNKRTKHEKQKKQKEIEKQKKPKQKRRKKMLLLLLTIWQFALCTFNLRDQPTNRARVLEYNKLWETFAYICLLYVHDENQDMLIQ